jgi:hypothetical protein
LLFCCSSGTLIYRVYGVILWRDYAVSYLARILFRIDSLSLKDHEHIDCFAPAQTDSSGQGGSFGKTIAVAGI